MEILARIIRPSFLHSPHQHLGLGRSRRAGGVERQEEKERWEGLRRRSRVAGEGRGVEEDEHEEQDAP